LAGPPPLLPQKRKYWGGGARPAKMSAAANAVVCLGKGERKTKIRTRYAGMV